MSQQSEKLQAQLDAAHAAIDELRIENGKLQSAARDVLRFHRDCICRHARRFLAGALDADDKLSPAVYDDLHFKTRRP